MRASAGAALTALWATSSALGQAAQSAAVEVLTLPPSPGHTDEIWLHFPCGQLELEDASPEMAELAVAAWNAGPGGRTQQRFAELGGAFELRLEGQRGWLCARVATGQLEAGLKAVVEALGYQASELSFEDAQQDAAVLRWRRGPAEQLANAALEFEAQSALWLEAPRTSAPSPDNPAELLEAAAQDLFRGATWGIASAAPREQWQGWVSAAAAAIESRFSEEPEAPKQATDAANGQPAPAESAATGILAPGAAAGARQPVPRAERLWLAQSEPGPEWLLLAFNAPEPGELSDTLWACLEQQQLRGSSPAAQKLAALLPADCSPEFIALEAAPANLLGIRLRWLGPEATDAVAPPAAPGSSTAKNPGADPEQRLAALLAWLRDPETWHGPWIEAPGWRNRLPAEAALLVAAEGPAPRASSRISAAQLAAAFAPAPRFVAVLAPAEKAAASEAEVGVRRLDGSPWQSSSRAGRAAVLQLKAALGDYAALQSLELEYRFTPTGRAPLALRQVRRFGEFAAEVFSGAAGGRADTPMLTIVGELAYREQQGRRLPLEGATLTETLAGEQRAWPRLLQSLAAQRDYGLEPAGDGSWLVRGAEGNVARLVLTAAGQPSQLVQIPGERSTRFDGWAIGDQGLAWPTGFATDSGRFELLAAKAELHGAGALLGPGVDSAPPPEQPYGAEGGQ